MMTSSNGNIFRVTGPLYGEFTGDWWIPRTKASGAERWCFFICVWINSWINNREAGDLRRYCAHYDVIVMYTQIYKNIYICESWKCWYETVLYQCITLSSESFTIALTFLSFAYLKLCPMCVPCIATVYPMLCKIKSHANMHMFLCNVFL